MFYYPACLLSSEHKRIHSLMIAKVRTKYSVLLEHVCDNQTETIEIEKAIMKIAEDAVQR